MDKLSAFGGPLAFLGANPRHDIVVFQGSPGPSFMLDPTLRPAGTLVELLSFPQAVDTDLQGRAGLSPVPSCSRGVISCYSSDSMLGAADYQGGRLSGRVHVRH